MLRMKKALKSFERDVMKPFFIKQSVIEKRRERGDNSDLTPDGHNDSMDDFTDVSVDHEIEMHDMEKENPPKGLAK